MSRFVSSGAIDPTSGEHVEKAEVAPGADSKAEGVGRNKEAWEAVQREVEEERKRRAAVKGPGEGEKSLFEVLQENKGMPSSSTYQHNTAPPPNSTSSPFLGITKTDTTKSRKGGRL